VTRRLPARVGCALAVVLAALPLAAGVAPAAKRPLEYCVDRTLQPSVVHFRSSDGARLTGIALGRGSAGVVLGHQLGSDLCEWLPYARKLSADGYRVLAYSFRGYGSSEAPEATRTRLDRDVIAAVAEIRRRGARTVVAVGASMGGTASLVAAQSIRPRLAAVISLSGPALFGTLDAEPAVRSSRLPALFIAGAEDYAFVADAERLAKTSRAPGKRLLIVSGAFHGVSLFDGPSARKVDAAIRAFLAKYAPVR
jgi:pimeloyl-ACP methyl ester carboxylesterase